MITITLQVLVLGIFNTSLTMYMKETYRKGLMVELSMKLHAHCSVEDQNVCYISASKRLHP